MDHRERKGFSRLVKILGLEGDDPVWDEFMDQRRGWNDLALLLKDGQIDPRYEQRAIDVLLTPEIKSLPFRVNLDTQMGSYASLSGEWAKDLTDRQADYVAEIIPQLKQQAEKALRKDDSRSDSADALTAYNSLILRLIKRLPLEKAEELFAHFNINDASVYWNFDTASGYNPITQLYHDPEISEGFKRNAASRMHDRIRTELNGDTQPREDFEEAYECYSRALGYMFYRDDGLPVSKEFLGGEIAFMLSLDAQRPVLDRWHTAEVLSMLENREIRHAFVRRQVLSGSPASLDHYIVGDQGDIDVAKKFIAEFPDDRGLVDYLEDQIAKCEISMEQSLKQSILKQRSEDRVREQMRVSSNSR